MADMGVELASAPLSQLRGRPLASATRRAARANSVGKRIVTECLEALRRARM